MAKEIKNTEDTKREFAFVFNKINYIIMIAGIVLLALGYILLAGGGSVASTLPPFSSSSASSSRSWPSCTGAKTANNPHRKH